MSAEHVIISLMQMNELYNRFLLWRDTHIKERHFLLFVCFLAGILTALAAYVLKTSIHFFQVFFTESFSRANLNFSYLLLPIAGILIAGLYVRYIVKDDISHGVTKILFSISQRKSRIKPHNM